jgi:hypothetical protein|tara:strand:+ start:329 stop:751 length:423 start_codon:yes stop_codon:yes gene_type:complete
MRRFLQSYRDILVYHDYGPLLLFWNIADLANNRVLWMSYGEALDAGQEWAYFQYSLYFVVALGMLFSLPNIRSCVRFVGVYLMLYIFSTSRFVYLVTTDPELGQNPDIGRSLVVTGVYFCLWVWLYVKMRVEIIHRDLNG